MSATRLYYRFQKQRSGRLAEQTDDQQHMLSDQLARAAKKPILPNSRFTRRDLKPLTNWIIALELLPQYKAPYKIFQSEVKQIAIGRPNETEDAAWRSDGTMFLATRQAGYNPTHMLKSLLHEIGHAFEQKLWGDKDPPSPWDRPPFVNDYAALYGEDFAETFLQIHIDHEFVDLTCPVKCSKMDNLLGDI